VIRIGAWRFARRRARLAARLPPGPLREYLSQPFPDPGTDCRVTPFLAVDLETTGLDPSHDQILSIGWVAMEGLEIRLASAEQHWVRPTRAIPESSAVIHQITDDQAARGGRLDTALAHLFTAMTGRVMLAHHAAVEVGFLTQACREQYGQPCLIAVVDTLQLAQRQLHQEVMRSDSLRLNALRARYNLPRYRGHDALNDALAAAELFAAQITHREDRGPLALQQVLQRPGALW